MNYIELINNMWSLREQGLLTSYECDLYLFLVHRCNRMGWKNPFTQPTDITCAILGINRHALVSRRNKIKQLGLVDFKEGATKTKPPCYVLCDLKDTQPNTQPGTQPGTQPYAQPSTINKTKQNKTISESEVDYQFVISEFNETCKSLVPVDKLTAQRRQKLDYIAQHIGIDKLRQCFKLVEQSHFLSKRKGRWRATFDWIIEPENMVKILEGRYSYEPENSTSSTSAYRREPKEERYGLEY